MTDDSLVIRRREGVATLVLNRPAQANTLSTVMLDGLAAALEVLAGDPDLRCVVLAAEGRIFCAGHDLAEMQATDGEAALAALFARCSAVMQAIRALPVPVIAQVQGAAVAAGCQLVAACDLAVAAERARFAVSGINLGLFCSTPAVALTRTLAPKAAFDMLFTGRMVEAQEALALGLVNRVVPDGALESTVAAYAAEIAAKSPAAVRLGKRMVYAQAAMPLAEAYRFAGATMAANMVMEDAREGVGGFLNRRSG